MSDAIDAASAGLFPVAFGNFSEIIYWSIMPQVGGLGLTTTFQQKTKSFFTSARVGGQVLNNEPVNLLMFDESKFS